MLKEVKAPKVASTANAAPTSPEAKAFLTEAHKLAKNAEDKKNFRVRPLRYVFIMVCICGVSWSQGRALRRSMRRH